MKSKFVYEQCKGRPKNLPHLQTYFGYCSACGVYLPPIKGGAVADGSMMRVFAGESRGGKYTIKCKK